MGDALLTLAIERFYYFWIPGTVLVLWLRSSRGLLAEPSEDRIRRWRAVLLLRACRPGSAGMAF